MPVSIVVLIAMLAAVAMVAAYRKIVSRNEDDFVHLAEGTAPLIANQRKTERSLTVIDRIGSTLTAATVVYGVALLIAYLYAGLTRPSL